MTLAAVERCAAREKLNCGCCADIRDFECERQAGHAGPHHETAELGYGLWYAVTWLRVDSEPVTPAEFVDRTKRA